MWGRDILELLEKVLAIFRSRAYVKFCLGLATIGAGLLAVGWVDVALLALQLLGRTLPGNPPTKDHDIFDVISLIAGAVLIVVSIVLFIWFHKNDNKTPDNEKKVTFAIEQGHSFGDVARGIGLIDESLVTLEGFDEQQLNSLCQPGEYTFPNPISALQNLRRLSVLSQFPPYTVQLQADGTIKMEVI